MVASPSLGAQTLPPTSLGAGLAALSSEGANLRRSQRSRTLKERSDATMGSAQGGIVRENIGVLALYRESTVKAD